MPSSTALPRIANVFFWWEYALTRNLNTGSRRLLMVQGREMRILASNVRSAPSPDGQRVNSIQSRSTGIIYRENGAIPGGSLVHALSAIGVMFLCIPQVRPCGELTPIIGNSLGTEGPDDFHILSVLRCKGFLDHGSGNMGQLENGF